MPPPTCLQCAAKRGEDHQEGCPYGASPDQGRPTPKRPSRHREAVHREVRLNKYLKAVVGLAAALALLWKVLSALQG